MGLPVRRALMVVVGVALLALYGGLALLGYRLALTLWAERPDPATAAVVVVATTLVVGYLSYRFGTARELARLDAVSLPRERAPSVHARVDRLCERMDVDRPAVALASLEGPNAFAFGGHDGGVVVLDRSLFRLLSLDELEAIVAHELAHLESHDSFVQTLAYTAVRTLVGFVLVVLAPVAFVLGGFARGVAWILGRPAEWPNTLLGRVRFRAGQTVALVLAVLTLAVRAHSRRREFAADDRAVEVTGDPLALARALRKIERAAHEEWGILSPLYVHGDDEGSPLRWLSTHPPMDDRVERLLERADERAGRRRVPVE